MPDDDATFQRLMARSGKHAAPSVTHSSTPGQMPDNDATFQRLMNKATTGAVTATPPPLSNQPSNEDAMFQRLMAKGSGHPASSVTPAPASSKFPVQAHATTPTPTPNQAHGFNPLAAFQGVRDAAGRAWNSGAKALGDIGDGLKFYGSHANEAVNAIEFPVSRALEGAELDAIRRFKGSHEHVSPHGILGAGVDAAIHPGARIALDRALEKAQGVSPLKYTPQQRAVLQSGIEGISAMSNTSSAVGMSDMGTGIVKNVLEGLLSLSTQE